MLQLDVSHVPLLCHVPQAFPQMSVLQVPPPPPELQLDVSQVPSHRCDPQAFPLPSVAQVSPAFALAQPPLPLAQQALAQCEPEAQSESSRHSPGHEPSHWYTPPHGHFLPTLLAQAMQVPLMHVLDPQHTPLTHGEPVEGQHRLSLDDEVA